MNNLVTHNTILDFLRRHDEWEHERDKKIDSVYKVIITGDGEPSLLERVRNLERYFKAASAILCAIGFGLITAVLTGHIQIIVH